MLAGAYSSALVPVGNRYGAAGICDRNRRGLLVANLMRRWCRKRLVQSARNKITEKKQKIRQWVETSAAFGIWSRKVHGFVLYHRRICVILDVVHVS